MEIPNEVVEITGGDDVVLRIAQNWERIRPCDGVASIELWSGMRSERRIGGPW